MFTTVFIQLSVHAPVNNYPALLNMQKIEMKFPKPASVWSTSGDTWICTCEVAYISPHCTDQFQALKPTYQVKGCGMGEWLVLVSPCFRENIVATCKIGCFLFSLDNLLQKNVIVLFFGNQISKWRSFEKRAIYDLLFTFFIHRGKVTKIPSAHISLTYIHAHILLTLLTFFA